MDGLALAFSDLPLELIERYELSKLVHDRGGEKELRFLRQVRQAILPIRRDGRVEIVPWGCRTGRFPKTGFTWLSTVEAGEWAMHAAQPIVIPAMAGFHNGVWFRIRQGIKGLIVEADEVRAAYMLVEPASYYYKIMTRAERMPVLIGEQI